jgi:class 3 adenylate cyclase/tetratricopeptide (TPR) repeat protein
MIDPIAAGERLKPYVPRLVIQWLRDTPEVRHRAVEGSLAFVDISGFTQLTEKLARRGKVGAEHVSDTLQTTFTRLLDDAYDYGAGLLKWGGDALLLLFDGDGHAERSCVAAVRMQDTLDRIGRLRAAGSTVTLRMSVGIHSGAFDAFLVGTSHRELIITGPAASATVAMESVADAGEIALSPATADLIGPGHVGRSKGDAVLLAKAPVVDLDPAPEVGDVSDIDLPSCVPVELRKQLVVEQGEAEHRAISVAFLQFSGTDELVGREGRDGLVDHLHGLVANVQEACDRDGVTFFATDIDSDGGKIILTTGAPRSGGNDEERLLRAVRTIMDRPGLLPLRIGVNSGRAFTCDFGPPYRRAYQIYGDAVNLAARVMGKSTPGQVLATEATVSRARTAYELEQLEPFMVKGKSEPVHAFVVGAFAGQRQMEQAKTPLVGRDEEMAVLTSAADSARTGAGRLVELIGEPGIGKSRLVEELESRSGIPSLWAVCEQYESPTPYFAFSGLLHHLIERPRDAPPEELERALRDQIVARAPDLESWLPLLGATLGLDLSPTEETSKLDERFIPDRTAEAIIRLLSALRPDAALLVFDDVHWMDEASVGVLARIAEHVVERPWVVLVTRREVATGFVPLPGPHVVTLRPQPLAGDTAAALVMAATESVPLAPHVLEALAERSGGNPFFLTELVSAALAGATLDELPDSVEALTSAHIDRLEPSERTILRYAAVLGASFDTALLVEALHDEIPALDHDVWSRLDEFLGEDEPGVLRFRHALIREAAYEGLPYRRRQTLHKRVAEAIERRTGPTVDHEAEHLSLHYFHAHDFPRAWHFSRAAGEHARAIYANVEAAIFYERALRAAGRYRGLDRAEVAAVAEALGDVRFRLGEFEEGGRAFRQARRLLPRDSTDAGRLRLKEALVPYRIGRYTQALTAITRSLGLLQNLDGGDTEAQQARLFVYRGIIRYRQGRSREAIHWLELAVASAERCGAKDALAQAYQNLDLAYLQRGEPANAVYGERALAIYEELGDLTQQAGVLNNLGAREYAFGRWNETLELQQRARTIWESTGDAWAASFAMYNSAEILSDQGQLDDAEPLLRGALRVWRAAGADPEAADAASQLGRLLARRGSYDDALALLQEARSQQESLGESGEALVTDARMAECLVFAGRPEEAIETAGSALARARDLEVAPAVLALLHRVRGWALVMLEHLDEAHAAFDESLALARAGSVDYEIAATLGALATLGHRAGHATAYELDQERRVIVERLGIDRVFEPAGVGESEGDKPPSLSQLLSP